jgi:glucose-6-phosphate isomerase
MAGIGLEYKNICGVSDKEIEQQKQRLGPVIEQMKAAREAGHNTDYAFLSVPEDGAAHETVQKLVAQKRALAPKVLVVIGIGGSNLGTMAVHQALHGSVYNELNPDIKVYFADTTDNDMIADSIQIMRRVLDNSQTVLLNVVSKSGTTTETIANFACLLNLLKQYHPDNYHDFVVATTDKDSKLWTLARQHNVACLEIPKKVGGRYSVFTPVGLFPLALLGVDTKRFLSGAASVTTSEYNTQAQVMAAVIALNHAGGKVVHDMFIFSKALQGLGAWYRQLLAESTGKNATIALLSTVSVGSTDLHSVGQRYLGGAKNIFTTFVRVQECARQVIVPKDLVCATLVPDVCGKTVKEVTDALFVGAQTAYTAAGLPHVVCSVPQKTAFFVGQFMQLKMMETVYVAHLLGVNPFDQPAVELYKKETRKILAHE